ncbi:MAG: YeeE/YedE thiosulfate transporter family protein [Bacteroidota bacterium]|nr:YeeE/YedE thiosulfate transporter family protein [Bacteroidota bacterium]
MENLLPHPIPWYIAGPLIGLFVPALLVLANKQLGVSSSFRHMCAAVLPTNVEYFRYNWKAESWQLIFVFGMLVGGFIARQLFSLPEMVGISASTKTDLTTLGMTTFSGLQPAEIFQWHALVTLRGLLLIVFGGFLVGFGTRYSNGCTSGHSIMGMSLLNLGSLIATIGFFMGGLFATYVLLPLIFKL